MKIYDKKRRPYTFISKMERRHLIELQVQTTAQSV